MKIRVLSSILIGSILIGIYGCGPTLQERQRKANNQYNIGVSELNRGNFAEALKAFEKARDINPNDPKIYNGLGLIYWYQKDYPQAVEEYKKALKIDPKNTDVHHNLGAAYAQMKQWDAALEEFKIAASNPFYEANFKAHYNLGLVLLEKGENVNALEEFHKSVQLRPDYSLALDKYGVALYRLNRFQEAIKQFVRAIETSTTYKLTKLSLKNLGNDGVSENEVLKKIAILEDQDILNKDNFLQKIEEQLGKEQTSIYAERIIKYTEATPNLLEPYLNLGIVYMQQGKKNEAVTQFKFVLDQSKDDDLKASARRYLEILE
jgi:Tfp pilus assembly protein PilF